jgi:hypothetical protein
VKVFKLENGSSISKISGFMAPAINLVSGTQINAPLLNDPVKEFPPRPRFRKFAPTIKKKDKKLSLK